MKIEDNIPIPERKYGRPRTEAAKAAWQMKVGQCVLCKTLTEYERVRQVINRNGGKYVSRRGDEGWRIWRIK
jgi:hypothetical protein